VKQVSKKKKKKKKKSAVFVFDLKANNTSLASEAETYNGPFQKA